MAKPVERIAKVIISSAILVTLLGQFVDWYEQLNMSFSGWLYQDPIVTAAWLLSSSGDWVAGPIVWTNGVTADTSCKESTRTMVSAMHVGNRRLLAIMGYRINCSLESMHF